MNKNQKRKLYESIMLSTSKVIKKNSDCTNTDKTVLIKNFFEFKSLQAAKKIGILIKKLIIPAISRFVFRWK